MRGQEDRLTTTLKHVLFNVSYPFVMLGFNDLISAHSIEALVSSTKIRCDDFSASRDLILY